MKYFKAFRSVVPFKREVFLSDSVKTRDRVLVFLPVL